MPIICCCFLLCCLLVTIIFYRQIFDWCFELSSDFGSYCGIFFDFLKLFCVVSTLFKHMYSLPFATECVTTMGQWCPLLSQFTTLMNVDEYQNRVRLSNSVYDWCHIYLSLENRRWWHICIAASPSIQSVAYFFFLLCNCFSEDFPETITPCLFFFILSFILFFYYSISREKDTVA